MQHCPSSSYCFSPQPAACVAVQSWHKQRSTRGKLRSSILTDVQLSSQKDLSGLFADVSLTRKSQLQEVKDHFWHLDSIHILSSPVFFPGAQIQQSFYVAEPSQSAVSLTSDQHSGNVGCPYVTVQAGVNLLGGFHSLLNQGWNTTSWLRDLAPRAKHLQPRVSLWLSLCCWALSKKNVKVIKGRFLAFKNSSTLKAHDVSQKEPEKSVSPKRHFVGWPNRKSGAILSLSNAPASVDVRIFCSSSVDMHKGGIPLHDAKISNKYFCSF